MGVIGGIILDEEYPVPAPIEGGQEHFLQEGDMRGRVEILLLVAIDELPIGQSYRANNFLCVTLAPSGNPGLGMTESPRAMQRRTLPERGFIFVND